MTDEARRAGTPDPRLGRRFFGIICGALLVLALIYVGLHLRFPPTASPISLTLGALISQAQDQGRATNKISASAEITVTMAEIKRLTTTVLVDDTRGLQAGDRQDINALINSLDETIKRNDQREFLARLSILKRLFETPAPRGFFWNQEPFRFLEILLWGIAGVLIHQIITSARYLRYGVFYREGIVLHIAQLITIPIVALVTVLLLSLVTLKITIGGNEVQLDLGDPRILAVVSFLIGLNFWKFWDLLQQVSDRIPGLDRTPVPGDRVAEQKPPGART